MITTQEIIRLAKQSGFGPAVAWEEFQAPFIAFAKKVRIEALEEAALQCESRKTGIETQLDEEDDGCAYEIRNLKEKKWK